MLTVNFGRALQTQRIVTVIFIRGNYTDIEKYDNRNEIESLIL